MIRFFSPNLASLCVISCAATHVDLRATKLSCLSSSAKDSVINLARTVSVSREPSLKNQPALVLVHGLDSTRFTFDPFLKQTKGKYRKVIAFDQRGHGETDLGDEDEYSAEIVAADIFHSLYDGNDTVEGKIVLVGHSMGGKVAMKFATMYPEKIAALVIEDMDIGDKVSDPDRYKQFTSHDDAEIERRRNFNADRTFTSFEEAYNTLCKFGYENSRVLGWKKDGRVFLRQDGRWFSGINPLAQYLASVHILSKVGEIEWKLIAQGGYPVWVFVAGQGSACSEENLTKMYNIMPIMNMVRFPNAWHSIHNSNMPEFVLAIDNVFDSLEERRSKL